MTRSSKTLALIITIMVFITGCTADKQVTLKPKTTKTEEVKALVRKEVQQPKKISLKVASRSGTLRPNAKPKQPSENPPKAKTSVESPVSVKPPVQKAPVKIEPIKETPAAKPTPKPTPTPSTQTSTGWSSQQSEMLGYINTERQKAGLKPLQLNSTMNYGAWQKSKDMAVNGYFSHTSPTYGSPFNQMKSLGITYRSAGENLALNSTVQAAFQAFMNSPGHRANILNPAFNTAGLGFYQINGKLYVTQWFIQK